MLVEFSLACICTTCGKNFSIYGVHIPRKCIKSMHINSCPSPSPKTPGRSFWKYVSLKTKWVKESMIYFVKTQSENMKMTKNISLFIFCMICNFCKCDGCTVLWIISVCVCVCVCDVIWLIPEAFPLLYCSCNYCRTIHHTCPNDPKRRKQPPKTKKGEKLQENL